MEKASDFIALDCNILISNNLTISFWIVFLLREKIYNLFFLLVINFCNSDTPALLSVLPSSTLSPKMHFYILIGFQEKSKI